MGRKQDALDYHQRGRKGKLEVVPTKPLVSQQDLSLAYTPGVPQPCPEIARHEASTLAPIGTGPWRLDLPGGLEQDQIRLVRFERHWDVTRRPPYPDGLSLPFHDRQAAAPGAPGRRRVPPRRKRRGRQHRRCADCSQLQPDRSVYPRSELRESGRAGVDHAGRRQPDVQCRHQCRRQKAGRRRLCGRNPAQPQSAVGMADSAGKRIRRIRAGAAGKL